MSAIREASPSEAVQIIDRLWAEDEPRVFIGKDQYVQNLDGWKIEVHEAKGEIALVAFTKGPAFHFHSFGVIPVSMKLTRQLIQGIIDREGYATTRTPKEPEFERQHRFNRIIGFVAVSEDEFDIVYQIRMIKLQRGEMICP